MTTTPAKFGPGVSIEEGVGKLRKKEKVAYLSFPHYFYLIAEKMGLSESWVCNTLSSVPLTFTPTSHSMIVAKNSPYFGIFNYVSV